MVNDNKYCIRYRQVSMTHFQKYTVDQRDLNWILNILVIFVSKKRKKIFICSLNGTKLLWMDVEQFTASNHRKYIICFDGNEMDKNS